MYSLEDVWFFGILVLASQWRVLIDLKKKEDLS
jgi:hypothetical protein